MSTILHVYAAGAIFVGLRLGWHMVYSLDRHDWRYNRAGIWFASVAATLLWPVVAILKLRLLLSPESLFEGEFGIARSAREQDHSPLRCSPIVRYRQGPNAFGSICGEFWFAAADVERLLIEQLHKSPDSTSHRNEMLALWLRRRDKESSLPPWVVGNGLHFPFIAIDLIGVGIGHAHCPACAMRFDAADLKIDRNSSLGLWHFDRILCPRGHPLLTVEAFHALCRPSTGRFSELVTLPWREK